MVQRSILRELFVLPIFVGWMVLLTVASLLPSGGVGFGETWDKVVHFGAYFITSLLFYFAFHSRLQKTDIYAVFFAFGYGVILEVAQLFVPGRICSLKDLMANFSGVLFFFVLYRLLWGKV
jgi:VanZ family protein